MFKRQETDLRRLLAMLLIPVCLMCAGCGGEANASTGAADADAATSQEPPYYDCEYSSRTQRVNECVVTLHDGRRVECVVLSGDIRSGISCDWANATKETDE